MSEETGEILSACQRSFRVLMAPDYRAGNPYQQLLVEALAESGVESEFPIGYRRVMPLSRMLGSSRADLLHLHWPDAYFRVAGDRVDAWRICRFPIDLTIARRKMPLVATAHNLYPHNRVRSKALHVATRAYYRQARRVIVHGSAIPAALEQAFGLDRSHCRFVPHGDLSVIMPSPKSREDARQALGMDLTEPVCLMFGSVEPYKGIVEMIQFWMRQRLPYKLVVAGFPRDEEYAQQVSRLAQGSENIVLRLGWMDDQALADWLAAADAVLFNYQAILVSGAATLARSLGTPIVLPQRLVSIDLSEPHPLVFRFDESDTHLVAQIEAAMSRGTHPELAADWRTQHAWGNVAKLTRAVYEEVLAE